MIRMYVKKIWSLNPNQYKYVEFNKAMTDYNEWVDNCIKQTSSYLKTFEQWLKTEI